MSVSSIGVIGLGIIGSRIASNLANKGHTVYVWSRSPRAVPNFLASARTVAEQAKVVQIFVRDDAALDEVITDMLPALTGEHVLINHSTVSPAATMQAAQKIAAAGAGFLDCPFTGSKMAAQNAMLVYYVGGDVALLERVRPILEASSARILHVGEMGHATILKIATNLITAVTVKGVQEALSLTQAYGIDPAHLLAAEEPNANFSPLVGMKLPAMMRKDYDAHFSLKNMLKDADYALALAKEKSVQAPALQVMADAMRTAQDAGQGEQDFCVIAEHS
jgi:3-hydroxyisobutyrate dehydrogenase-like beta-hydroxyacid dehydrogenase